MKKEKNRWLIALSAVAIHLSIGSAYAYSVYTNPINESLPAFIGDMFGTKQLGAIHGYILTAWSMAGVMGPIAVSSLKEISGSYTPTFYLFSALLIIAFIVSRITARDVKKIRENNKQNSAA